MPTDHIDRNDLARMADDGCPNNVDRTGESKTHDLAEFWAMLGKDA